MVHILLQQEGAEKSGNGEEISKAPSGKVFFLIAPKQGTGKSLSPFFHCHFHTVAIGQKIGGV